MRGEAEDPSTFRERLADEAEAVLLEVPQPAVNQPRRPARRPDGDVLAFHEGGPQIPRHRIQKGAATDDPAADDDDIECAVGQRAERPPAGIRSHLAGQATGGSSGSPTSSIASPPAGSGRGRAIRQSAAAVPRIRITIRSGVLNTTSCALVGRKPVTIAAPSTTTTQAPLRSSTSRSPTVRSATIRLAWDADGRDEHAPGERLAHLLAEAGLWPVERDREIGPDRRIGRLAAGEVDGGGRVDREHGHHRGASTVHDLDRGPDGIAEDALNAG